MQLTSAKVFPVNLDLKYPVRLAGIPPVENITAVFVRVDTLEGKTAWGCTVAHPDLNGEKPEAVLKLCRNCADLIPDLHPTNIAYSLAELSAYTGGSPATACAFDLVFHDLLGLATGLPLYRLLGGYRNRMPSSITVPVGEIDEGVETARQFAETGFRSLKIKGGIDPEQDIRRVEAIHRALPSLSLQLDAEGAYTIQQSLEIIRALRGKIEIFEQPTPAADLNALCQVTHQSTIQILADQSLSGPDSALRISTDRCADSFSIKLATCGGFGPARQISSIGQAAGISTTVSCLIEPALLIGAGLSFALSSPNVAYCNLDGHLFLNNDPTEIGFLIEDGCLIASEVPGLGCRVNL